MLVCICACVSGCMHVCVCVCGACSVCMHVVCVCCVCCVSVCEYVIEKGMYRTKEITQM